jgi:hypothetical protein
MIRCTACGVSLIEASGPCTRCGGTIEVAVQLIGTQADSHLGRVGAVAQEPVAGGGERIRYSAASTAEGMG